MPCHTLLYDNHSFIYSFVCLSFPSLSRPLVPTLCPHSFQGSKLGKGRAERQAIKTGQGRGVRDP